MFSSDKEDDIENYEFQEFDSNIKINLKQHSKIIKQERKNSAESNFEVSPIVKHHRSINEQEHNERQHRVDQEIKRRLHILKGEAYAHGRKEGRKKAYNEIHENALHIADEKAQILSGIIEEVISIKKDILLKERDNIYIVIKNLVKWIILKELKADGEYIPRLLSNLVKEIGDRSNILIRVNKDCFKQIPEALGYLENHLCKIENVRVEIDYNIGGPGIVLETENNMIDGTLVSQFENLDKLFEKIGVAIKSGENLDVLNNKNLGTGGNDFLMLKQMN